MPQKRPSGKQRHSRRPDRRRQRGSGFRSFKLLYEDSHILAVAKPEGILVTMAESNEMTLQDQVRRHCAKSPESDAVTPACVHRIDRYTSGVVLFGRTKRGLEGLNSLLREGEIEKRYYALVLGDPPAESGEIDVPLIAIHQGKKRMAPSQGADALPALTHWTVEERLRDPALPGERCALVVGSPKTGRTHQLRVHFAYIDAPIAGDTIYGLKRPNRYLRDSAGLVRQFLHARSVAFDHPVSGERVEIEAKLPKDLSRVLKFLREKDPSSK